jgi:hypothetical protein
MAPATARTAVGTSTMAARPSDSDAFRNQSKRAPMSRLNEKALQSKLGTVQSVARR